VSAGYLLAERASKSARSLLGVHLTPRAVLDVKMLRMVIPAVEKNGSLQDSMFGMPQPSGCNGQPGAQYQPAEALEEVMADVSFARRSPVL
jgi:hypothetical protein